MFILIIYFTQTMDDISHRPRVTAIMTEYAPHLIKVVSHATYMRENKIAMEGRKVDLIAIYSNLPRDKINKDDKFLKDILIEYFSPDEANVWLQRPRVYGLKGLTGNDLDLQKRCQYFTSQVEERDISTKKSDN